MTITTEPKPDASVDDNVTRSFAGVGYAGFSSQSIQWTKAREFAECAKNRKKEKLTMSEFEVRKATHRSGFQIGNQLGVKHGHARTNKNTRTYTKWHSIISRCLYPCGKALEHYRDRGIGICERWRVFENFLADMGTAPEGMEIERIDNDKGYFPENCKWATRAQNQANRTVSVNLSFQGETHSAAEWARKTGMHPATLGQRLRAGWSIEQALTMPPRFGNRKNVI